MSRRHRTRPFTIIGPRKTSGYVTTLFDLAYTPGLSRLSYPVEFIECEPGGTVEYSLLTIHTALPDHGIPVLSTRWEVNGQPRFAFSADGKATTATRALFKGVPTLVHECYALPGGEGPVHTHVEKVLEVAAESGTQTLVLVHQASHEREGIAGYVRMQTLFKGQVLMPEGPLKLTI